MGTLSLTNFVTGADILASGHNGNNSALLAAINGGLDTANWASGKIFHPNKILQDGAIIGQALVWDGTDWAPATVSASPLAARFIGPANGVTTPVSTTSATNADVDAANMTVTFIAPSTGTVVVELCASARLSTSSAAIASDNNYRWNLRDSGGDVTNTEQVVRQFTNAVSSENQDWQVIHAQIFKTGLTGGNSYTWKWGHARTTTSGVGTVTASIRRSGASGFQSMVVWPTPAP